MYRGTFAMVDLDAFSHNVQVIRNRLGPKTELMLAIKANAYGHGVGSILGVIQQLGVTHVAVATLEEALEVRTLDTQISVLILGALGPCELTVAAAHNIDVMFTDTWGTLEELPEPFARPLRVHIPFDTGMNRLGIKTVAQATRVIDWIQSRQDVVWQAVCTHLACSDAETPEHAQAQVTKFHQFIEALQSAGYPIPLMHVANSGGVLRNADWHFDMVRVGIAAYGYSPDDAVVPAPELRSVMHLYSTITRVATVEVGETIGYGATFTADRTMRVATVAIGYADGIPRVLSNCGVLSVRGTLVNVVGRICMDQLMIDVTDVEGVTTGDFVTVFGRRAPTDWTSERWRDMEPQVRPDWLRETFMKTRKSEADVVSLTRVASLAQTIAYEIVCQLSPRVPKLVVDSMF